MDGEARILSSIATLQEQLDDLLERIEIVSATLDETLVGLAPRMQRSGPCRYCGLHPCGVHCTYCLVDCTDDDAEHGPACPTVTGLWPTDVMGAVCVLCGDPLGETHALIPEPNSDDTYQAVCLGCKFNEGADDAAA